MNVYIYKYTHTHSIPGKIFIGVSLKRPVPAKNIFGEKIEKITKIIKISGIKIHKKRGKNDTGKFNFERLTARLFNHTT